MWWPGSLVSQGLCRGGECNIWEAVPGNPEARVAVRCRAPRVSCRGHGRTCRGDVAKDRGAAFGEPRGLGHGDDVNFLGVVGGIVEARAAAVRFTSGELVPRHARALDPVDETKLWEVVPGDTSVLGDEYNIGEPWRGTGGARAEEISLGPGGGFQGTAEAWAWAAGPTSGGGGGLPGMPGACAEAMAQTSGRPFSGMPEATGLASRPMRVCIFPG